MQRCPRCRSSMVIDFGDPESGYPATWKCIGCGREIYQDETVQTLDEQLRTKIEIEVERVITFHRA